MAHSGIPNEEVHLEMLQVEYDKIRRMAEERDRVEVERHRSEQHELAIYSYEDKERLKLIQKQREIREMVFQLHLKRENEERKKLHEEKARHIAVLEEIARKRTEFEIQIFEEKQTIAHKKIELQRVIEDHSIEIQAKKQEVEVEKARMSQDLEIHVQTLQQHAAQHQKELDDHNARVTVKIDQVRQSFEPEKVQLEREHKHQIILIQDKRTKLERSHVVVQDPAVEGAGGQIAVQTAAEYVGWR